MQWLVFTLLAILVQGLFALFEMACVSFHKVRLQYYLSQKNRRANWIHFLLKKPSRLFGTTLIGINTALQVGSECARRFYESIGLDPDWAPITQVFLVVIFGELVPMFTARKIPDRIAFFLVPLMIFIAKCLSPLTWAFDQLSSLIHRMMGKSQQMSLFFSREEIKMAFEDSESKEEGFNAVVGRVFQLKNFTAGQLMLPLADAKIFSSTTTVEQIRKIAELKNIPILPIYHRVTHNIISIVRIRDLLRAANEQKILNFGKSPWFVTKDMSILQILDQFRRNNQSIAVILEPSGQACGILMLDQIIDAIFGPQSLASIEEVKQSHYLERTLFGSMKIAEFNRQFKSDLPLDGGKTLSDLVVSSLGHLPARGETVWVGDYEFVVLEPTLRGVRTLYVRSGTFS